MKLLIGMVAASVAVALPALAQEAGTDASTMTCAEFVGLDNAGQTNAMSSIEAAAVTAADGIEAGTGVDTALDADDTMADEAAPAEDDTAAAATATEGETGAAGAGVDMTAALLEACSGVPDMRVTDAMMQLEAEAASDTDASIDGAEANGG